MKRTENNDATAALAILVVAAIIIITVRYGVWATLAIITIPSIIVITYRLIKSTRVFRNIIITDEEISEFLEQVYDEESNNIVIKIKNKYPTFSEREFSYFVKVVIEKKMQIAIDKIKYISFIEGHNKDTIEVRGINSELWKEINATFIKYLKHEHKEVGKISINKCLNCGASLDIAERECKYCKTTSTSHTGWLLERIEGR